MVSNVTLEGFPEFLAAVKNMGDSMKKKVMAGIMRKNLETVAGAIRAGAPIRKSSLYQGKIIRRRKDGSVSTESMPGNLKKSIGVRTFTRREEVAAYAGIQHKKGNDGWYGFFVERGTREQAKQPFIAQAAAHSVPAATVYLQTDIVNYIAKEGKKLGLNVQAK